MGLYNTSQQHYQQKKTYARNNAKDLGIQKSVYLQIKTLSFIITTYQYEELQVLREIWYTCPYVHSVYVKLYDLHDLINCIP